MEDLYIFIDMTGDLLQQLNNDVNSGEIRGFESMKKVIRMFIRSKFMCVVSRITPIHTFTLVYIKNGSIFLSSSERQYGAMQRKLREAYKDADKVIDALDVSRVVEGVCDKLANNSKEGGTPRLVLFLARSAVPLTLYSNEILKAKMDSLSLTIDALFIHDDKDMHRAQVNNSVDVLSGLGPHLGYVIESHPGLDNVLNCSSKLLVHPNWRHRYLDQSTDTLRSRVLPPCQLQCSNIDANMPQSQMHAIQN